MFIGGTRVQGGGSRMTNTTTTGTYESKTVAELKEILQERELPVSGRKAELIARLEEFDASINYRPDHIRKELEVFGDEDEGVVAINEGTTEEEDLAPDLEDDAPASTEDGAEEAFEDEPADGILHNPEQLDPKFVSPNEFRRMRMETEKELRENERRILEANIANFDSEPAVEEE